MRHRGLLGLAVLFLIVPAGWGSDIVGVYALVDKVELEPADGQPERMRVWGVFSVSQGFGEQYTAPAKGYLYFKLPDNNGTQARKEWNDLKKLAGSKQCVAFAARDKVGGVKVRTDKEHTKGAVAYPVAMGVTKLPANQYMAKKLLAFTDKP